MGENKHIEELDVFAKKYIKEVEAETPSIDFTNTIMQRILKVENTALYKATPLISKKAWFVVLGTLVALLFIPFKSSERSESILDKVGYSYLPNIEMPSLFADVSLSVSTTTIYSFVFLAILVLVQVHFLKNYFINKL